MWFCKKNIKKDMAKVSSCRLVGVVELFLGDHRNRKNNTLKTFYKRTLSAYIAHESDKLIVPNTDIWEADTEAWKILCNDSD